MYQNMQGATEPFLVAGEMPPAGTSVLVDLPTGNVVRRHQRAPPYSAWPSMIGPNSSHFSPVNFIICTCSIG